VDYHAFITTKEVKMEKQKRILTPEVRARLLGFAPVSQKSGVPFTPEQFKGEGLEDLAPVFYQRGWTEDEKNGIMSSATGKKDEFDYKKMKEVARVTVVNMENVIDLGTGEEIKFLADESGSLSKDVFNTFPFALQMSLFYNAQKISGMGGLDRDEAESLRS
jgi:hypothetical protein